MIAHVNKNSLASKAHSLSGRALQPGVRIKHVNYVRVTSHQQASEFINAIDSPLIMLDLESRNGQKDVAWVWRRDDKPPAPIGERRVFAVLGADTTDPDIGTSVRADIERMKAMLRSHIPEKQLAIHQLIDGDLSAHKFASVFQAVNSLAKPDDALLLYLSSHGSTDPKAVGATLGNTFTGNHVIWFSKDQPILHDRLLEIVGALDLRLKVVISDSCRDYGDTAFRLLRDRRRYRAEQRTVDGEVYLENPLQDLLLLAEGVVDWYSCEPGETSSALEEGGLFTLCGIAGITSASRGDWGAVASSVRESVSRYAQSGGRRQHPEIRGMISPDFYRPNAGVRKSLTYSVLLPIEDDDSSDR